MVIKVVQMIYDTELVLNKLVIFYISSLIKHRLFSQTILAQSAGAVEYTNYFSADG